MTLVDANVLLNAINRSAPDHHSAKGWLDHALSGGAPVGFAWAVLVAVVRLATRPGLFPARSPSRSATRWSVAGWARGPQPCCIPAHVTSTCSSVC